MNDSAQGSQGRKDAAAASKGHGISAWEREQLVRFHTRFAQGLGRLMLDSYGRGLRAELADARDMAASDFSAAWFADGVLVELQEEKTKGGALLVLDRKLAFALVESAAGAPEPSSPPERGFTDMETAMLASVLVRILGSLKEGEGRFAPHLRISDIDADPSGREDGMLAEGSALVSMRVRIGDLEGNIALCYSRPALLAALGSRRLPEPAPENPPAELEEAIAAATACIEERIRGLEKRLESLAAELRAKDRSGDDALPRLKEEALVLIGARPEDAAAFVAEMLRDDAVEKGRQAALALGALGVESTVEIMKRLPEECLERLTFEIARLYAIVPADASGALRGFLDGFDRASAVESGIDFAREALEGALGAEKAIALINRLTEALQVAPFDFIGRCDPEQVFEILNQEGPQTIALVLIFLKSAKAALLLSWFPGEAKAEVARRIASMGPVSPEIVREIERVMEKKLSQRPDQEDSFLRPSGVDSLVEILCSADQGTEDQILSSLGAEDPELMGAIKKKMFVFDDIVHIDEPSLRIVLSRFETALLPTAMRGVAERTLQKVLGCLEAAAAAELQSALANETPPPDQEIESAQRAFVDLIRALEAAGQLGFEKAD